MLPDCVLVTPAGKHAEVHDGRVHLSEPGSEAGVVPSIDRLFESLARGYGDRAIGVLLSGTGHDGTRGAEAIRLAGGRVLVQLPDSATQGGMAQSALSAGIVCDSLTPDGLADWLNDMDRENEANPVDGIGPPPIDGATLRALLDLVQDATQTDFTRYKEPTLRRQVLRRIAALRLASADDYLRLVRANPGEARLLRQSFMISVTGFFRDAGVFETLRKVLDSLADARQPGESVRVWVPGCATGEEAYSIAAILADRLGERLSQVEVQVFATDLDTEAIQIARTGVYPRSSLEGLDSRLRERFFTEGRDSARVAKTLRELCVFAEHDLLRHPPFTRMDLVSCRNVLIYFNAALQAELLGRFHYALKPGGLLLLGKSECTETVNRLFEPLDTASRLYRRRDVSSPPLPHAHWGSSVLPPGPAVAASADFRALDTDAAMRDLLLLSYAPPSVLVNDRLQPLHFNGNVERYLSFPKGQADFSVVALSLPCLRNEVRTGAHLVLRQGQEEVAGRPTPVDIGGETVLVRVVARRGDAGVPGGDATVLLSFEEQPLPAAPRTDRGGRARSLRHGRAAPRAASDPRSPARDHRRAGILQRRPPIPERGAPGLCRGASIHERGAPGQQRGAEHAQRRASGQDQPARQSQRHAEQHPGLDPARPGGGGRAISRPALQCTCRTRLRADARRFGSEPCGCALHPGPSGLAPAGGVRHGWRAASGPAGQPAGPALPDAGRPAHRRVRPLHRRRTDLCGHLGAYPFGA